MNGGSERRQHADAPVPRLIEEALDDDRAVAGQLPGHFGLLGEVLEKVARGLLVEAALRDELGGSVRGLHGVELAGQASDRAPQLDGAPGTIAVPERHLARFSRRGTHQDPIEPDLLDAPRRRAEKKDVAGVRLEDHLFVELSDAATGAVLLAGQKDTVESTIRNGAGVRHGDALGATASSDAPLHAIPRDAGPQLTELVRWIAAAQHVENGVEGGAGQLREGRGRADERVEVLDAQLVQSDDGDDLLRQDIERIARVARRLDLARFHAPRHGGAREQVAAELREDDTARRLADSVVGAPDPLQAGGHRRRRLDLHHEVHSAHVDPELHRRGRHDRRQEAALEPVLDHLPRLARDRAVVRESDLVACLLVERRGEPLGQSATVDEDHGRAMSPDHLDEPGMNRRPDGAPRCGRCRRPRRHLLDLSESRHVLDGDLDRQLDVLPRSRIDDPHRTRAPAVVLAHLPSAEKARDLLEGTLGRRKSYSLQTAGLAAVRSAKALQSLQREAEVRAPLRTGDGVNLIENHRLDAREHLAGLRGEEQIERLGSRDQDVRGMASHPRALRRRRVAAADHNFRDVTGNAETLGGGRDAGDRRAQVALDVEREGLQRRDIERATTPARRRRLAEEDALEGR